jgi:ABC-2 type transport system permease protein
VGVFISSLTDNQGFAAGIGIAVILFNYYSVSLAEYISSTAKGTMIALWVIGIFLGVIIRLLTKNENAAYAVTLVIVVGSVIIYFVKSELLEGILPTVMSTLSLFERFYTFVNGVFDVTAVVFYLTVIVFFLFLSVQSLEKRRYN